MIRFNTAKNIMQKIDRNPHYYAIDSASVKGLHYVYADGDFAVIRGCQCIWAKLSEIEELKSLCLDAEVKQEIADIYEDLKYLKTAEVIL